MPPAEQREENVEILILSNMSSPRLAFYRYLFKEVFYFSILNSDILSQYQVFRRKYLRIVLSCELLLLNL